MVEVKDKQGQTINVGDTVYTPFRGGKHEGEVSDIVTTKEEGEEKGVKNPPKVLFTDQNNKDVSHNPETLTKE
ncbi:hypothetical protein CI109_103834 [Kwoniella shandongensis]|uniref:Uncharacterized protein n=1 Tax=Kwoniella shandongensis TaxID=1734106 RepID=A0A5M6C8C9_9TREE|nr:uncharacterized protein CI109_000470 [Kwoniella shandongensis]KAA5530900.1 hypothetical protein CI109_000470 [Kwoniella shandongensis]